MTPEGRVKNAIKEVLDKFGVYYFMPVQTGFGAAGLDFHCVIPVWVPLSGLMLPMAFFIEAKRPGKGPTDRQEQFAKDRWEQQHARTFVIDGDVGELTKWLQGFRDINERFRVTQ